jgi:Tol biopolymer transport system component
MDLDGGGLAAVPGAMDELVTSVAAISPDGQTLFFRKVINTQAAGQPPKFVQDPALWRMPLAGGVEEIVADNRGSTREFSPNGKYLLRRSAETGPTGGRGRGAFGPASPWEVVLTENGDVVRSLESPAGDRQYKWAPSSDALTFIRTVGGVTNLWSLPLDGRPSKQLTQFAADEFGGQYAWIADGSRLVFTRRSQPTTDVLLIRNFR